MTKMAAMERISVALVVGYFSWGAYNEVRLERADAAVASASGPAAIVDGVEFANAAEVVVFQFEATRDRWFPWAGLVGMPVCYLILSATAACYGGIVREFYDSLFAGAAHHRRYLLGLVLGPLLYGASSFAPFLLIESDKLPTPRLITLLSISALCGCFVEKTWQFLEALLEKFFKRVKE